MNSIKISIIQNAWNTAPGPQALPQVQSTQLQLMADHGVFVGRQSFVQLSQVTLTRDLEFLGCQGYQGCLGCQYPIIHQIHQQDQQVLEYLASTISKDSWTASIQLWRILKGIEWIQRDALRQRDPKISMSQMISSGVPQCPSSGVTYSL